VRDVAPVAPRALPHTRPLASLRGRGLFAMQPADGVGTMALVTAALLLVGAARPGPERTGIAFFYGHHPPVHALARFRTVVLEPAAVDGTIVQRLRARGTVVHAYLSVGELRPGDLEGPLPEGLVLGRNDDWHTLVMDPAADGWQARLIDRARDLRAEGYDGLFLDTLDSFRRFVSEPAEVERRWHALARLVRALHEEVPGLRLTLNRGFELLSEVAPFVDAVAAESLMRGWDPARGRFVEVPAAARAWLVERLHEARDHDGLEVVAIDYVPMHDRALARRTARSIARLGIVPYVATPALDVVGVGPPAARVRTKQKTR
jgi:hypothetical protein